MFTKRISGCVLLILLIIGSQPTGVLMEESDDACFNKAQICFEPYIQSGEMPADVVAKNIIPEFVVDEVYCKERFELVQCALQNTANCFDLTQALVDDVSINVVDIFAYIVCEVFIDGVCHDNYHDCDQGTLPRPSYDYPSGGYSFHVEVDFIYEICKDYCLAEMMTFCPYMSIFYARTQVQKLLVHDSNTVPLMVDFANHTCPVVPEADLQCALYQVSVTQFTECIDLALQDHPQVVMFLNMVSLATPEELRMNCQVMEDMNHCIDISVGEGCDEVTAQVIKDGLFIFGFQFNMSTCEPESGPIRNGAIYVVADTWTLAALASVVWVLTLSIHALM